LGLLKPGDTLSTNVNPTGVFLVRFDIIPQSSPDSADIDHAAKDGIEIRYPGLSGWKTEF